MQTSVQHNKRTLVHKRWNTKEFFIWCDESDIKGRYCSNLYGGVLVNSDDLEEVQHRLRVVCDQQNFYNEIKWQKVSECYLDKYKAIMAEFFALMSEGKVKARIMFIRKPYESRHLDEIHKKEQYF